MSLCEGFIDRGAKAPALKALIVKVWKAAHYADIPRQLAEAAS